MLVVALGPRQAVASMEATAIASGGCRGNTAGARGAGLMPRRHRTQPGRVRSKRPRPRRSGLPDALRATVHWLSLADSRSRRSEAREQRREAGQLTDRLRDLPFAEQYAAWQRARWHLGLGEGPVDLLGTRGDTLLAAWFAGMGQVCYESLLQRAAGDDLVALRACDAVQGMRHADSKRRALDRVSRLLRLWRLPARGTKVIRWPGRAAGCTAASALEDVKARLTRRGLRLWRWVRGRTRVVLPKTQSHASHWNHIRTSKASDMLTLLASGVAAQPPCAESQVSMVRAKRYWRLPVEVTPAQARRQGEGEVRAWAQKCFGASYRCPGRASAGRREGPSERREDGSADGRSQVRAWGGPDGAHKAGPAIRSHGAHGVVASHPLSMREALGSIPAAYAPSDFDELAEYRAHLTKPAEGEVLVQEDKDKSAAWRLPAQLYLHWVAHLLVADAVHWRQADCSVQEVSALYHHLHRGGLPRRFAYMASARRWADFGLNYMYMNLKAKCFAHEQGRTCQKPGHSCLRKVVSWCSHPAVDYYRWLARGAQTLVAAWGRGHDVSSLKTAAAELRAKVALLDGPAFSGGGEACGQAPDTVRCARCKACMTGPAVVVADAAQMYEEVPPSRVRSGLLSLIDWATGRGYAGVAVSKRTAGPSFLVRQRWRHPPGTVLFTWDELSRGLDLALAQSAVSVGNSVWVQAEGLPIGGPHSPACCSVVLGADEATWTDNAATRAAHGFNPSGRRLEEQVALARYVDDLIMVSRVWCSSCLEDMLTVMYRKPVQFDRQATAAHGQPWLDMWVSFRHGALEIHMDGQEQDWVQCQASVPPAKTRLKPYLGDDAASLEALRLHVSGRSARLRQAGLDDTALHLAVKREVLVIALHGYPREMMRRVWSRSCQYPAAAKQARLVLGTWQDALPGLARLKPDWAWTAPAEPQWEA